MKTHALALIVRPEGEGILSEMCTKISLDDEGGGPFVAVEQIGRAIQINADEWKNIRAAIDEMIAMCIAMKEEEANK